MTIGARLKEERERLGFGLVEFSALGGASKGSQVSWEKGTAYPNARTLSAWAGAGLDVSYVVTGIRSTTKVNSISDDVGTFEVVQNSGPGRKAETGHTADFALVPRYAVEASAGPGTIAEDAPPVELIAYRRDWLRSEGLDPAALVAITARGDSMLPHIRPGALLLVDTASIAPRREGVYVIQDDGHLRVKRISPRTDGAVQLTSDNPLYPPETVPPDRVATLHVVGLVVVVSQRID